jgi:hypothetical protein
MSEMKLVSYDVDTLILNIRYADSDSQPIRYSYIKNLLANDRNSAMRRHWPNQGDHKGSPLPWYEGTAPALSSRVGGRSLVVAHSHQLKG